MIDGQSRIGKAIRIISNSSTGRSWKGFLRVVTVIFFKDSRVEDCVVDRL